MKKVLAFAGSNSRQSINKQLVTFAGSLLENVDLTILDLNDFELPLFGVDMEREEGIPEKALEFKSYVEKADGVLISLAEHNGAYSAVFKNIFDWISRTEGKAWDNKPMFLMATSPGGRGGSSVLEIASKRFPFNGAQVIDSFSLPSFGRNFDPEKGITDSEKLEELKIKLSKFQGIL